MPSGTDPQLKALKKRLRALEKTVSRLEETLGGSAGSGPAAAAQATASADGSSTAPGSPAHDGALDADAFAPLHALREEAGEDGAVRFVGTLTTRSGPAEYQWTRTGAALMDLDWAEHADRIAALGHPLRLAILHRLIDGARTVAKLVDELELGSTGVAYHHLSALQQAGWVTSPRRGAWTIPVARIIPLATIILATEA